MKKIAEYLRTQAAALNAMADADNLKGKYADKLGEDARGLGRKLDEAEDRYREVKGHLTGWANELEGFQKKADKALEDAKDAQRVIDAHEGKADDKPDSGKGEKGDKGSGAEHAALKRAKEDLENARGRYNSAVGDYDERSGHFAGKIRDSIDDDMKDSWWNDFKGAIADADWIGEWADRLSWVATIVGAAALIFPGLGVVALFLTGVVAFAHVVQASTGNGSWFDVAMDIGAIKLAAKGIKAGKAIKALQESSRKTAAGAAKESAESAAARTRKGAMDNARKQQNKGGGRSGGDRDKNRARRLRMEQKNRTQGAKAGNEVRDAEMPQISSQEKARSLGDEKLGQQMKDIHKWRDEYPDNTQLADNARAAEHHARVNQVSWGTSTALDTADKSGDALSGDEYSRMKDRMTRPVGSRW